MQRVYEENEWGKVSKRIVTILLLMNSLHVWHLKMRFCDQVHTASEHATYL